MAFVDATRVTGQRQRRDTQTISARAREVGGDARSLVLAELGLVLELFDLRRIGRRAAHGRAEHRRRAERLRVSDAAIARRTDPGQIAGRRAVEQMQLDDLRVVELLERHDALDEELRCQTIPWARMRTG